MNRLAYRHWRGGLSLSPRHYGSFFWARRLSPISSSMSYTFPSRRRSSQNAPEHNAQEDDFKYLMDFLKPSAKEKLLSRQKQHQSSTNASHEALSSVSETSAPSYGEADPVEANANEATGRCKS